jgi:predicted dehydrogenase
MIKIGILSFAHLHAHSYAACLNGLPNTTLAGVWDDNSKRGRAAAKQYGARFHADLGALLASGVEGVIVASENIHHRALVEAAAAAGKWVLCEKPLATTIADAKAMIVACRRAKVGLGTAFPCRFSPPLMAAREQLRRGDFGDILAVACTNHGQYPGGWFSDPALSGGGAVMDHTVHVADALRWMLGKEFTRVYCEAGNQLHAGQFDTDDLGSLHLEMAGGIQVSHLASWSRAQSFPTWGDVTMEFVGTNGVLYVDAFRQKLDVYNDATMRATWPGWGDNPDLGLIADFVEAVRDRRSPAVTGEDGLRAVEVTVAAHKAMRARRPAAV